jgi:formylmethanofuran dehydrogenase subunit D
MKKFRVTLVGDDGTFILPIPESIMKSLGWSEGDEVKVEPVVIRSGKVDYLVIEKRG